MLIFGSALCTINAYDKKFFCDNQDKLCEGLPKRHTGCSDGKWAVACGAERSAVKMTDDLKDFILDLHNSARSQTARGKSVSGAGTATRMVTMKWDPTLAQLAMINAKKCTMHHSDCLNTPEFKMVGQNVGFQANFDDFLDNKEVAKMVITPWVDEYKQTTLESIKSNPDNNGYVDKSNISRSFWLTFFPPQSNDLSFFDYRD